MLILQMASDLVETFSFRISPLAVGAVVGDPALPVNRSLSFGESKSLSELVTARACTGTEAGKEWHAVRLDIQLILPMYSEAKCRNKAC